MDADRPTSPPQAPLSVTWREWLRRLAWGLDDAQPVAYDAIVIGSGYGGSVAALRLAQKGYRTLVLERGSEYLPGEFPNDFSLLPKAARANVPGLDLPAGRASGLLEMHVGMGMVAITGNGLGGGSLVNAGVVVEPDPDVYAQDPWPAAIRHAEGGGLADHFRVARHHLDVHRWDASLPGGHTLHKTLALRRLGEDLEKPAAAVDVTIDPVRCVRCGDCASGCNVRGAKRTLATTYLQEALDTGLVQIVTQAEVYRFDRGDPAACGDPLWEVHAFATDAQHQFLAPRELFADRHAAATHRCLRAPLLFVCAGTMGTTQLLLRSQARSKDRVMPGAGTAARQGPPRRLGLRFSPALGTRVSGNGDSLSWLVDEPEAVSSLGKGEAGVQAFRQALQGGRYEPAMVVGPTITAAVDLRDRSRPLDQRLLVQDGAVPRALAPVYRELLATAHGLRQMDSWWPRGLRHAGAGLEDPLAASDRRAQQAQVLLTMGHDGSPARMVWMEGEDRAVPYLPDPGQLETYKRQQRLFDRYGDRHVHNPLWRLLPRSAEKLMSGPKPPQVVTTVHPLGGCVMGDDPRTSVVDHLGRPWAHEPGQFGPGTPGIATPDATARPNTDEPHHYRGLFLLDGSIVPTSLGCNPLLTITALAERSLAHLPPRPAAPPIDVQSGEPRRPEALASQEVPIDAVLHETLLARDLRLAGALADAVGGPLGSGRLEACFLSDDLRQDLAVADHAMRARARLWLGPRDSEGQPGEARAEYESAQAGSFKPVPATPWSSGPLHLVLVVLQLAWLLALAVGLVLGLGQVFHFLSATLSQWIRTAALATLLVASVVLLPFPRSVLTWWVLRGRRDVREKVNDGSVSLGTRLQDLGPWVVAMLRQMVHASEKRVMRYDIVLRLRTPVDGSRLPREIRLLATKTVMYRASVRQVLAWAWDRCRRRGDAGAERVRIRPTVWEQMMDAQVRLLAGGRELAHGTFRMGFENLTSSGLSAVRRRARGPIELGRRGDTTTGLAAAAGYGLLFLRLMLRTRLLDFRLPTYSGVPVPDVAPDKETRLRHGRRDVEPVLHWLEDVPRGPSNGDQGDEATGPLRLQLRQYRQRDAGGASCPPDVVAGTWMGIPVARAKAVLLLHAFGQSGLSFTLRSVRENLAEHYHRQGYEVWILETRMSTRGGYARDPSTVDQIAAHDIPHAVDYIRRQLRQELPAGCLDGRELQISAFAQCIGSAALWMSLLSGRLSTARRGVVPQGVQAPLLSKLSHAMFSQVHPLVVGGAATQAKTWMPAFLQALFRRGWVAFGVRGPQDGYAWSLLDRLFASMPTPGAERRRPDGHDDGAATCRRIRFVEAPLFRHENIHADTIRQMNLLFGDANLRLFSHARRFVDRERLVDEDGTNRYVTDEAIRTHLAFPVQLLHGERNELFAVDSCEQSFRLLRNFHPGWQDAFCAEPGAPARPLVLPGYGHVDVLIGQDACSDAYPAIAGFFLRCHERADHAVPPPGQAGWVARPPRLGPFMGWLREGRGGLRLRVSFAVDDTSTSASKAPLPPVVLRRRDPATGRYVTCAAGQVTWKAYAARTGTLGPGGGRYVAWRFAWADIPLPAQPQDRESWQVLTLHPSWYRGRVPLLSSDQPGDDELDAYLQAMGDTGGPEPVEPPLAVGPHDFGGCGFELRRASFQGLSGGDDVTFGVGCCRYPGLGIDRPRVNAALDAYLRDVRSEDTAFAMLLGDQIYADATAGLLDPASPLERYFDRYAAAFARDGLGGLLARMPVYMTPDDHEWIDNYPAASPLIKERWPQWSESRGNFTRRENQVFTLAGQAITAFERLASPTGLKPVNWVRKGRKRRPPSAYHFDHGPARFFVLDTRHSRQRDVPAIAPGHLLGRDLRAWLQQPQAQSRLNVIACGSVVLPGLRPESDPAGPGAIDTWQYAQEQRRELLELLVDLVPGNFLLLSGDYHVSGAVLVRCLGRTVGAAIVAPPLYAPLPYANATPQSVWVEERIELPSRRVVDMAMVPGGEFLRGSGLGNIHVRSRGPGSAWSIVYDRKLWTWERGSEGVAVCDLPLPGPGVSAGAAAAREREPEEGSTA